MSKKRAKLKHWEWCHDWGMYVTTLRSIDCVKYHIEHCNCSLCPSGKTQPVRSMCFHRGVQNIKMFAGGKQHSVCFPWTRDKSLWSRTDSWQRYASQIRLKVSSFPNPHWDKPLTDSSFWFGTPSTEHVSESEECLIWQGLCQNIGKLLSSRYVLVQISHMIWSGSIWVICIWS